MPKPTPHTDSTVLYLRSTPREVARKLKALAALQGKPLSQYVKDVLAAHVADAEQAGILPKKTEKASRKGET